MTTNNNFTNEEVVKRKNRNVGGASGGIYGLAFIGAAIYFISHATSFLDGSTWFYKSAFLARRTYLQNIGIFKNVSIRI